MEFQRGARTRNPLGRRMAAPGAGGRFRFDGLRPGFYRLWALYSISGASRN